MNREKGMPVDFFAQRLRLSASALYLAALNFDLDSLPFGCVAGLCVSGLSLVGS